MAQNNSITKLGNNVIQTGKHEFTDNQIEYNGVLFDCRQCSKNRTECCNVFDENDPNRLPCMKCVCQGAFDTMDESRTNKVNMASCQNCRDVSLPLCRRENHLINRLIQDIKIFDCSQNILVDGTANAVEQVQMSNQCTNVEGGGSAGIAALQQQLQQNVLYDDPQLNWGSASNFFLRLREEGFSMQNFLYVLLLAVCASFILLATSDLLDSSAIAVILIVTFLGIGVWIYLFSL